MRDWTPRRRRIFILIALALMVGMHRYFDDVFAGAQEQDAAARHEPRGNLSDLYIRWRGAQELLLHKSVFFGATMTVAGLLVISRMRFATKADL